MNTWIGLNFGEFRTGCNSGFEDDGHFSSARSCHRLKKKFAIAYQTLWKTDAVLAGWRQRDFDVRHVQTAWSMSEG